MLRRLEDLLLGHLIAISGVILRLRRSQLVRQLVGEVRESASTAAPESEGFSSVVLHAASPLLTTNGRGIAVIGQNPKAFLECTFFDNVSSISELLTEYNGSSRMVLITGNIPKIHECIELFSFFSGFNATNI